MMTQYDALINTPFGAIAISVHANQLVIELLTDSPTSENQQSSNPQVAEAYSQIMQYLAQPESEFNLAYMTHGTPYQQRVWQAIASIPFGQTRTYGQLANQIGSGPRAVANACGANQLPLVIPCHRVVSRMGSVALCKANLMAYALKSGY